MDVEDVLSGAPWDLDRIDQAMDHFGKVWRYSYKRHWIGIVNALPENQRFKFVNDTLLAPHGVRGGVEVELMRRMAVTQNSLQKGFDFRTNLALTREYLSLFAADGEDFDEFVSKHGLYSNCTKMHDQHDLKAEDFRWLSIPATRPYFG